VQDAKIPAMGSVIYHFSRFSLNPLARELRQDGQLVALSASAFDCLVYLIEHRERPVGRDELISAVWGRADVSDSLLAQTIVRLRRALGDAGNEQHSIKTIARIGYRWMLETNTVEHPSASVFADTPATTVDVPENSDEVETLPTTERRVRNLLYRWRRVAAASLLIIASITGYIAWRAFHTGSSQASIHFDRSSAAVLPADVHAPEDWNWLHFGLMDLISNRLRDARVPTETSQAVLELLRDDTGAPGEELPSRVEFALVIRPKVTLDGENWLVHLDARGQDGRSWKAESSSTDVLKAVRGASDVLLAELGYGVKGHDASDAAISRSEYMQHINAARLAGQPAAARALLEKVPAELRNVPEMAYVSASLDCDEGNGAACKQGMLDLLKRAEVVQTPFLHGEVLTSLGLIYQQEGDLAKAMATLTDAVHILQGHDNEALATTLLDRSYVEQALWRLEDATADLGRARVTYALAGDAVGAAKADFEMGLLVERRAQPDAAISLLQRAYDQFQRMGMRSMLPSVMDGLADVQKMLLRFSDELATTDRFWPLDTHDLGFMDRQMRRELTMVRAIALADNGRTTEATMLAEGLLRDAGPRDDAALLAETNKLLAEIALNLGEDDRASSLAAKALTTDLQADDQRDYASVWLTRITALLRSGHVDDVRREAAAMGEWRNHLSFQDDWVDVYVTRAKAAALWSAGNRDGAIAQLKLAMGMAEKLGVPELVVSSGEAYGAALLDVGQVDQAMAVSGRMSIWNNTDWRAAWLEACVYRALGQMDSWNHARASTQHLAGDRPLPEFSARLK
jgi:DNA-binding winged helix-turn-helix (wHTH) protein/tetratricopeptide (TPR) repeat protein